MSKLIWYCYCNCSIHAMGEVKGNFFYPDWQWVAPSWEPSQGYEIIIILLCPTPLTGNTFAVCTEALCAKMYGFLILIFCSRIARNNYVQLCAIYYEMGLFYCHFGSSHCLQIAHFKIPRHVCFMVDFPKTVSGKIQKFKLQEMVLEEGSLETGWTDLDTHMKIFVQSKTVCTFDSTATVMADLFPVMLCLYHVLPYIYPAEVG